MNQDEAELLLYDRLEAIKSVVAKVGEDKIYLSFSGGKDSTVVHHLLDMAIPNNKIKRVFINTGIEYQAINDFVKEMASKDERFVIIAPSLPIKPMLEKYGYPFKSKLHSHYVSIFNHIGKSDYIAKYLGERKGKRFICPNNLKYQFTKNNRLFIDNKCCDKLKKEPMHKYCVANGLTSIITGIMNGEGGSREFLKSCVVKDKDGNIKKFHPLAKVSDEWEKWFIQKYEIKLCSLYYAPFNFKRTGCKGCPFSLDLQEQLSVMEKYMPNERKQCEIIWKPVYDEYRRLNYRLKKNEQGKLL